MIELLDSIFFHLNTNSYFIGIMMIVLNIGTRYLMQEFGSVFDFVFNIRLIKRLMLFTVFFVATRNVKVSIILTGIFIILALEFLNENSKYCIIPKDWLDVIKKSKQTKTREQNLQYAINILKENGLLKQTIG